MTLHVIIDNGAPMPDRLRELIGVDSFNKIIFKRRTLSSIVEQATAAAGLAAPIHVTEPGDWAALSDRVRRADQTDDRFLVCPSGVIASGAEVLAGFLRQARYSPQNILIAPAGGDERDGWCLMTERMFRAYLDALATDTFDSFFERHRESFVRMDDRVTLIDLGDEVTLLEFLSGTFDVRFFNAIERDEFTITKRSTDKAKLQREYDLWQLLPPRMQMFFVRPFDFTDHGDFASYKMERLFVPDMAVQWLHQALNEADFRRFLNHVLYFVSARAERPAKAGEAENAIEALFVTKVRDRIEQLKAMPAFAAVAVLAVPACGSIDALFDRYLKVFQAHRHQLPSDRMVIGHGDLCFSNILYAKTSQTIKFIDPRGASSEADLWTHPFYDLAKLSHSILGNYDFVNQDLFDIKLDEALRPQLVYDRQPAAWAAPIFEAELKRAGLSVPLIRLCEASLFISMLPLHIDRPRKVLGFILVAIAILDQLENRA